MMFPLLSPGPAAMKLQVEEGLGVNQNRKLGCQQDR